MLMGLAFELKNSRQLKKRWNEGLLEVSLKWTLSADLI